MLAAAGEEVSLAEPPAKAASLVIVVSDSDVINLTILPLGGNDLWPKKPIYTA